MEIVDILADLLYSKYNPIDIYTEEIRQQSKESFQIVTISTHSTTTHSDTIVESRLMSIIRRTSDTKHKNKLFDILRRELPLLLNDYATDIEFTSIDNQLHAIFNVELSISYEQDGELLEGLDIVKSIR